jgi:hypothetical protein
MALINQISTAIMAIANPTAIPNKKFVISLCFNSFDLSIKKGGH